MEVQQVTMTMEVRKATTGKMTINFINKPSPEGYILRESFVNVAEPFCEVYCQNMELSRFKFLLQYTYHAITFQEFNKDTSELSAILMKLDLHQKITEIQEVTFKNCDCLKILRNKVFGVCSSFLPRIDNLKKIYIEESNSTTGSRGEVLGIVQQDGIAWTGSC